MNERVAGKREACAICLCYVTVYRNQFFIKNLIDCSFPFFCCLGEISISEVLFVFCYGSQSVFDHTHYTLIGIEFHSMCHLVLNDSCIYICSQVGECCKLCLVCYCVCNLRAFGCVGKGAVLVSGFYLSEQIIVACLHAAFCRIGSEADNIFSIVIERRFLVNVVVYFGIVLAE